MSACDDPARESAVGTRNEIGEMRVNLRCFGAMAARDRIEDLDRAGTRRNNDLTARVEVQGFLRWTTELRLHEPGRLLHGRREAKDLPDETLARYRPPAPWRTTAVLQAGHVPRAASFLRKPDATRAAAGSRPSWIRRSPSGDQPRRGRTFQRRPSHALARQACRPGLALSTRRERFVVASLRAGCIGTRPSLLRPPLQ